MRRLLLLQVVLIFNCCLHNTSYGQIIPKDYDTLNYRLVGFSVPENTQATSYVLEVHEYFPQDVGGYTSNPLFKKTYTGNRMIEMMPAFGRDYMWRVKYTSKKKIIDSTAYHFFSTGYSPVIDTSKYRLRIIDSAADNTGIYVMVDYISVIYDLKGNPIWYLPAFPVAEDVNIQTRDLKPTTDGTFTAASGLGACEFDYNATLLWLAPNDGKVSGDTSEFYHHEFTKLSTGNYMVCGLKYVLKKLPDSANHDKYKDLGKIEQHKDGSYYIKVKTTTLIEYDAKGNVVWRWLSEDYFSEKYAQKKKTDIPLINPDIHLNGFEFDEKNKVIYLSFRNTHQVVKIEYPSGKILNHYGNDSDKEGNEIEHSLFYGQHCIRKSKDGRLYLFNNNREKFGGVAQNKPYKDIISYVDIFEESALIPAGIKKTWEFSCDIDTYATPGAGAGGSVSMMDNKDILANMGNRMFIVSPEKKILWNVIPEKYNENDKYWLPLRLYRANYINTKDIEKFIFK